MKQKGACSSESIRGPLFVTSNNRACVLWRNCLNAALRARSNAIHESVALRLPFQASSCSLLLHLFNWLSVAEPAVVFRRVKNICRWEKRVLHRSPFLARLVFASRNNWNLNRVCRDKERNIRTENKQVSLVWQFLLCCDPLNSNLVSLQREIGSNSRQNTFQLKITAHFVDLCSKYLFFPKHRGVEFETNRSMQLLQVCGTLPFCQSRPTKITLQPVNFQFFCCSCVQSLLVNNAPLWITKRQFNCYFANEVNRNHYRYLVRQKREWHSYAFLDWLETRTRISPSDNLLDCVLDGTKSIACWTSLWDILSNMCTMHGKQHGDFIFLHSLPLPVSREDLSSGGRLYEVAICLSSFLLSFCRILFSRLFWKTGLQTKKVYKFLWNNSVQNKQTENPKKKNTLRQLSEGSVGPRAYLPFPSPPPQKPFHSNFVALLKIQNWKQCMNLVFSPDTGKSFPRPMMHLPLIVWFCWFLHLSHLQNPQERKYSLRAQFRTLKTRRATFSLRQDSCRSSWSDILELPKQAHCPTFT